MLAGAPPKRRRRHDGPIRRVARSGPPDFKYAQRSRRAAPTHTGIGGVRAPGGHDGRTARMLDHEPTGSGSGLEPDNESTADSPTTNPRRRRAASRPAGAPTAESAARTGAATGGDASAPAEAGPAAKRTRAK